MLGCLGEVADGLRGRVGWGRDRLRGSLRAIQPYYYYVAMSQHGPGLVRSARSRDTTITVYTV